MSPPRTGTRLITARNAVFSQVCRLYYTGIKTASSPAPLIADIGGIGRNQVKSIARWSMARVVTINLYDDSDIQADAVTLSNVEDGTFDGIYSSHLIEHLPWWEMTAVLGIWRDKLKPGGRIEIRCPDFEWINKRCTYAYKKGKDVDLWEDVLLHTTYGPAVVPWHRHYGDPGQHHRNILSAGRLGAAMRRAGFVRVRRISYFKVGFDYWPYDISLKKYYGKVLIRDLVMEGYK